MVKTTNICIAEMADLLEIKMLCSMLKLIKQLNEFSDWSFFLNVLETKRLIFDSLVSDSDYGLKYRFMIAYTARLVSTFS